jgi:hypothetical protein
MRLYDIVTESDAQLDEKPMGMVQKGIASLGAKLPGSLGAKAQGKLDTGMVANQLYKEFATFLGRTGQQATDVSLRAFLQQKGAHREIDIDKILSPYSGQTSEAYAKGYKSPWDKIEKANPGITKRWDAAAAGLKKAADDYQKILDKEKKQKEIKEDVALGRAALNKIFTQVAQQLAQSGSGAAKPAAAAPAGTSGTPAEKPRIRVPARSEPVSVPKADAGEPAAEPSPSAAPTAPTNAPSIPSPVASRLSAPAAAPKPGIVSRVAGAVKKAFSKGGSTGTAAPAAKAPATAPTQPTATGQESNIEGYVQNWAKTINATQDKNEKIKLAKEIINFLGDRKDQPEAQRAIGQATAVLKRSGLDPSINSKFLRALQTGAKMERKIYALANYLLEATGLTWKDLGIRVVLTESTFDTVTLKLR